VLLLKNFNRICNKQSNSKRKIIDVKYAEIKKDRFLGYGTQGKFDFNKVRIA